MKVSPGRRFAGVVVSLLAASVGVLVAYGATWVMAVVPIFAGGDAAGGPGRAVTLTGRELAPLGAAVGWVGLAAIAALLATRTWGRRVTGAVVVLAGGAAGVTGIAFALTDVASGGAGAFVSAALGEEAASQATEVSITAWWVVAVLAGLLMLACGLLALAEGPAWPRLGARYSRPDAAVTTASAASAWDALDRGEDPTLVDEPRDAPAAPPGSMGSTGLGSPTSDPHPKEER